MGVEVEALGTLATAGLAAREIDGARLPHDPGKPGLCANCEAPVSGRFCANCGQAAHVHRSLSHVAEELLHGITHFDGKAWKTLPLLVFRPGKLTRDYVRGRRARYIAPVALFLLTVFLMFFAFSFIDVGTMGSDVAVDGSADVAAVKAKSAEAVRKIEQDLAAAERDPARAGEVAALKIALATARAASARAGQPAPGQSPDAALDSGSLSVVDAMKAMREADARGELRIHSSFPALDSALRHALANPELTLYKVQQKAYKFSFVLVPLSLPVLWLMLFWKRDVYVYDHAVFALYSISFMSLLLVLVSVLLATSWGGAGAVAALILLVPPIHMFAQLKGAYRLSTFGALWRASILTVSALITLGAFAAMIVALGVVD